MGEIGREYDLAVLGGGPAGYMAAIRAGQLGLDTVLIEKEDIGGTCLNRGCIPSKMLLNVAAILKGNEYLERVGAVSNVPAVNLRKVQKENRRVVDKLRRGVEHLLERYDVDVVKGVGSFESSHYVRVRNGRKSSSIRFRKAVLATGSSPRIPKGVRIGGNIITSREALFLEKVPRRLVIAGAGFVAAELGAFYAALGAEVHVLARSRLLSKVDRDIVSIAERGMGVRVHEECAVESVENLKTGARVAFSSPRTGRTTLKADKVLIAMGSVPNLEGIGLENTNVKVERGRVAVDSRMLTTDPNIYAAGDVTPGPMLAHKGFMQGKVAAEAAAGVKDAGYDVATVPYAVFTVPEIAGAGIGEDEAKRRGLDVSVARFPFRALGRAVATGSEDGMVKLVFSRDGRLLGVLAVGNHASEMIGEAALALEMGAYLEDIEGTVHIHPTFYEALHEAAELALGRPWHYLVPKK